MAKTYENLSRRGLIQLNKDFDVESGGQLSEFLEKNENNYEDIRPIECVVNRADQVVDTISTSGVTVRAFVNKQATKIIDKAFDLVQGAIV